MSQLIYSASDMGDQTGSHEVVFSQLEDSRILYINGEINSNMAYHFNTTLLRLEHENSLEDIVLYINSPGGSVTDGLSMIDTMNLVSCDVSTVCIGMAASMGAMLLLSGARGKRFILPHASVLLHQPLGGTGLAQASDVEIVAKRLIKTRDTLYSMIQEATGQPYERIEQDCDRDYILSAEEAVAYGVVDKIVSSHKNGDRR